jgi:hypothetical protein
MNIYAHYVYQYFADVALASAAILFYLPNSCRPVGGHCMVLYLFAVYYFAVALVTI